jgi:hypothetical protein
MNIEDLPSDVFYMIAKYLSPKDIIRLRGASLTLADKASEVDVKKEHEICTYKGYQLGLCGHGNCGQIEANRCGQYAIILKNMIARAPYDEYKHYLRIVNNNLAIFQEAIDLLSEDDQPDRDILASLINSKHYKLIDSDKLMRLGGLKLIPLLNSSRTDVVFTYLLEQNKFDQIGSYITYLDYYTLYELAYLKKQYPTLHRYFIFDIATLLKGDSNFKNYYAVSYLPNKDFLKYIDHVKDLNQFTSAINKYNEHWVYLKQINNQANFEYLLDHQVEVNSDYIFNMLDTSYSLVLRDKYHIDDAVDSAFIFSLKLKDYSDLADMLDTNNLDEVSALKYIRFYHDLYQLEKLRQFNYITYLALYNQIKDSDIIKKCFCCSRSFIDMETSSGINTKELLDILNDKLPSSFRIDANIEYLIDLNLDLPSNILNYIVDNDPKYLGELYQAGYNEIYNRYLSMLHPDNYNQLLTILGGEHDGQILYDLISFPQMLKYVLNRYTFDDDILYDSSITEEVDRVLPDIDDRFHSIYNKIWGENYQASPEYNERGEEVYIDDYYPDDLLDLDDYDSDDDDDKIGMYEG